MWFRDAHTFNEQAWMELEALMFALDESRQSNAMAKIELERVKDEAVVAVFKADGCLYPRNHVS